MGGNLVRGALFSLTSVWFAATGLSAQITLTGSEVPVANSTTPLPSRPPPGRRRGRSGSS
jgi:hypothetical protein